MLETAQKERSWTSGMAHVDPKMKPVRHPALEKCVFLELPLRSPLLHTHTHAPTWWPPSPTDLLLGSLYSFPWLAFDYSKTVCRSFWGPREPTRCLVLLDLLCNPVRLASLSVLHHHPYLYMKKIRCTETGDKWQSWTSWTQSPQVSPEIGPSDSNT